MSIRERSGVAIAFGLLVAACATAAAPGSEEGPLDAAISPHHDAANATNADAGRHDASVGVGHDAAVDAVPPDSAIFCSDNSQCTNSGECCITLGSPVGVCGAGIVIGSSCVPD
jgi:hypothetical protein